MVIFYGHTPAGCEKVDPQVYLSHTQTQIRRKYIKEIGANTLTGA